MMAKGRIPVGALVVAAVFGSLMPTAVASAAPLVPEPVITPVAGAPTNVFTTVFDLGVVGYQQSEVFVSGTANAYTPTAPLTTNGKWNVAPFAPQAFKTRAVVYRPIDPARFNGTVFVEWLNVSGGLDAGPGWTAAHNELIRRGFAWVGVSAQAVGLNAAKAGNPARYGTMNHPGDSYSYDIFSQVGQAVRDQATTVLGGLQPRVVLASGESQSAFRLITYINAVQPLVHAYDGFLVHSRFGSGSALSQAPLANVPVPSPTFTRRDLDVPVLVVQMETDVAIGSFAARQRDTRRYRLWEVAGTAHADSYTLGVGWTDTGDGQGAKDMFQSMRTPPLSLFTCATPINTGPQHWVVENAAYRLHLWVKQGKAPAKAPRLRVASASPFAFALDGNGNVRGGIRTPQVDVPVATLSGLGQSGASFCSIFGTTVPFSAAKLAALYPTHGKFTREWKRATAAAVDAGFISPAGGRELKAAGAASTVPN
jgi:hypothetical protein